MKKLALFFIALSAQGLFAGCTQRQSAFSDYRENINKYKSQLRKFGSQYFASVVLSSCIGAITGGLNKYVEKQFIANPFFAKGIDSEFSPIALCLIFLSWSLESELRNDLIAAFQQDLDEYGIGYKK